MKIAVTGGAGFIGSNLVRALSEARQVTEVVVVDDLSTGSRDNVAGPARFVEGTILPTTTWTMPSPGRRASSTTPRSPRSRGPC